MTSDLVLTALAIGVFVAFGVMLLAVGFNLGAPAPAPKTAKAPKVTGRAPSGRAAVAVVIAFVVFAVSGWLLLGVAAGMLVLWWGRVFRSTTANNERARLEAIAKWLEDLRDVVGGSNLSMEAALEQTADTAPTTINTELARFVAKRRRAVPIEEALIALADDLAHPTADTAIAAMLLAVGTSGASLARTLSTLAVVARDEVASRVKSDRIRAAYEQTMRRLVILSIVIVGFLRLFAPDLVAPLSQPVGQAWLAVPIGVWTLAIVWLRSLAGYQLPRRYRLRAVQP